MALALWEGSPTVPHICLPISSACLAQMGVSSQTVFLEGSPTCQLNCWRPEVWICTWGSDAIARHKELSLGRKGGQETHAFWEARCGKGDGPLFRMRAMWLIKQRLGFCNFGLEWEMESYGINKSQKLVGAPMPLLTNQDKKLAWLMLEHLVSQKMTSLAANHETMQRFQVRGCWFRNPGHLEQQADSKCITCLV